MGILFSNFYKTLVGGSDPTKILMVGLDAAGKTTILERLKLNETVTTIPTIGFNVEEISYKNLDMTIWDLGGQEKIRALWGHYFENNDGIIYVVDSTDVERIEESAEELQTMLKDEQLAGVPVIVYANKQDLPEAVSVEELIMKLGLMGMKDRAWHVESSVATVGHGLYEGLDWLSDEVKKFRKTRN